MEMLRYCRLDSRTTITGLACYSGCGAQFYLPNQSVAIDAGMLLPGAEHAEFLLLTHGHIDHCGAFASFVLRRTVMTEQGTTVVCPDYMVEPLKGIMEGYRKLQMENAAMYPELDVRFIAVEKDLSHMRLSDKLSLDIFNLYHSPRSVGYGIYHEDVPVLATVFDTAMDGLVSNIKRINKFSNVMLECTMLGPSDICTDMKHMNLVEINAILSTPENVGAIKNVVLTHFSPMYSEKDLHEGVFNLTSNNFIKNNIELHFI